MIAKLAKQQIDGHEDICGERYAAIVRHQQNSDAGRATLHKKVEDGFNAINNRLWAAVLIVISAEGAMLWYFVQQSLHPALR